MRRSLSPIYHVYGLSRFAPAFRCSLSLLSGTCLRKPGARIPLFETRPGEPKQRSIAWLSRETSPVAKTPSAFFFSKYSASFMFVSLLFFLQWYRFELYFTRLYDIDAINNRTIRQVLSYQIPDFKRSGHLSQLGQTNELKSSPRETEVGRCHSRWRNARDLQLSARDHHAP